MKNFNIRKKEMHIEKQINCYFGVKPYVISPGNPKLYVMSLEATTIFAFYSHRLHAAHLTLYQIALQ